MNIVAATSGHDVTVQQGRNCHIQLDVSDVCWLWISMVYLLNYVNNIQVVRDETLACKTLEKWTLNLTVFGQLNSVSDTVSGHSGDPCATPLLLKQLITSRLTVWPLSLNPSKSWDVWHSKHAVNIMLNMLWYWPAIGHVISQWSMIVISYYTDCNAEIYNGLNGHPELLSILVW